MLGKLDTLSFQRVSQIAGHFGVSASLLLVFLALVCTTPFTLICSKVLNVCLFLSNSPTMLLELFLATLPNAYKRLATQEPVMPFRCSPRTKQRTPTHCCKNSS